MTCKWTSVNVWWYLKIIFLCLPLPLPSSLYHYHPSHSATPPPFSSMYATRPSFNSFLPSLGEESQIVCWDIFFTCLFVCFLPLSCCIIDYSYSFHASLSYQNLFGSRDFACFSKNGYIKELPMPFLITAPCSGHLHHLFVLQNKRRITQTVLHKDHLWLFEHIMCFLTYFRMIVLYFW